MTKITLLAAAAAAAFAFAGSAEARSTQTMRQAGTLTCNLDTGVGLVLGSVRDVACVYGFYDRRGRWVRESYAGTMNRAGIDLGITSGQQVSFAVMTPGGRNRAGQLSRAFDGSSSDASVVFGPGTQSLLGQGGERVGLQAVSGSGQVGFGVGFGATALDLHRVPNAAYTSFR